MIGKKVRYAFHRPPSDGMPELACEGNGVQIIPGLGEWVLLHASVLSIPDDAIPVADVVAFLEQRRLTREDAQ